MRVILSAFLFVLEKVTKLPSPTLHPLHRSFPIESFYRLIHRTLLGVRILQPAFVYQPFQVTGCGGWGEIAKLFETTTGEVLVRLEIIDEQGVYLVDVQQGGAMLVFRALELRLFRQVLFQGGVGTEIYRLDADVLPVHIRRGDVLRSRQGQAEIADAIQMHTIPIAQVEDQLVVQLGQYCLDVAHGQGT